MCTFKPPPSPESTCPFRANSALSRPEGSSWSQLQRAQEVDRIVGHQLSRGPRDSQPCFPRIPLDQLTGEMRCISMIVLGSALPFLDLIQATYVHCILYLLWHGRKVTPTDLSTMKGRGGAWCKYETNKSGYHLLDSARLTPNWLVGFMMCARVQFRQADAACSKPAIAWYAMISHLEPRKRKCGLWRKVVLTSVQLLIV